MVEAFRSAPVARAGGFWLGYRRWLSPARPLPDLKARFGRYHAGATQWVLDWEHRVFPPEWGVATRLAHFHNLAAPAAHGGVHQRQGGGILPRLCGSGTATIWKTTSGGCRPGLSVQAHIGWIFQTCWTLRSEAQLLPTFTRTPVRRLFADAGDRDPIALAVRYASRRRHDRHERRHRAQNDPQPQMWRQWLKPRVAAVIEAVHQVSPRSTSATTRTATMCR